MSDDNTQDKAEPSPASAGSLEPAAWWFKCDQYESVTLLREHADAMAEPYGTTPVPLFRHPQPTLTDEEREAVTTAMNDYAEDNADEECAKIEATLRGLLERLK